MPQYKLAQMMLDDLDNKYVQQNDGQAAKVADFVENASDSVSEDWSWGVPAPWLADAQSWGFIAMVNLVHGSLDLLPASIRSARNGAPTIFLDSARLGERLTRPEPNLRLAVVDLSAHLPVTPVFTVADGQWAASPAWNAALVEKSGDFSYKGVTTEGGDPLPRSIAIHASVTTPYFDAAGQCLAVARLLTMLAAQYKGALIGVPWQLGGQPAGSAFDAIVELAKTWYGLHLGALGHPTETLVHELFHTTVSMAANDIGLLEWEEQLSDTTHCGSGCGQETMSSTWQTRLTAENGAWLVTYNDDDGPLSFSQTKEQHSHSNCVAAGEAASLDDGRVNLDWDTTGLGTPDASVAWGYTATDSKATGDRIHALERTRDFLTEPHQFLLDAATNLEAELAKTRRDQWATYLLLGGPITEAALEIARLTQIVEIEAIDALYAPGIAELRAGQAGRFEQMCWSPSTKNSSCGPSGSCGG